VSDVVRLMLVSHAMTDAMSAGRFPLDEPVNDLGRRQIAGADDVGPFDIALCGPERRTRTTAELLGLSAEPDVGLRDLDPGRWRGGGLDTVDPGELAVWCTDPQGAPHGGESVVELVARVRNWLAAQVPTGGRVVAVTHPAVIRAALLVALDAPPNSFWRIDIEPLSRTTLHHRGGAWTLRCR
jgi:broad specificity phosphatase PhoE